MDPKRPSAESRDVEQSPLEKSHIIHQEHSGSVSQDDADFLANFSEERKKRVVRKVDVSDQTLTRLKKSY